MVLPVTPPQGLTTYCHSPTPTEVFRISFFKSSDGFSHLPLPPAGRQAACVAAVLKTGRSGSMCTRHPPGACATPRGTGLRRRPWVRDHGIFIQTWRPRDPGWRWRVERWRVCAREGVCVCTHA